MIRCFLLLCLGASPLAAQIPFDGCVDRSDRPVRGIVKNDMGWAGTATELNGESVIYWNAKANARMSRTTQIFVYLHECAHHSLGHIFKDQSPRWELEADCWAVQLMAESGMARGRHLEQIENELRNSTGDQLHLGGHARTRSLVNCIKLKTDRKAWATSLGALLAASDDGFAGIQGQSVPRPSANTGIYESELDLPGTYDCEITRARAVRCMVFAARDGDRVSERFRLLTKLIEGWLPSGWSRADNAPADSTIVHHYAATDSGAVHRLELSATSGHRILFVMHPSRDPADSAAPLLATEAIEFRSTSTAGPAPSTADAARPGNHDESAGPVRVVAQGAVVRLQVPKLGGGWIRGRVARTASATPCLLFELERRDSAGRTQFVFLSGVRAVELDRRTRFGPVAGLPPAQAGDWLPLSLADLRQQDARCRR